ncbi:MAG: serine protease [Bacteroidales bacterium]|nr:serine protease [Bacteroidales bacterium]
MLLSINSWWASMEVLEKIYWAFALPFSAVFVIQLIMTLIGAGGDGDLDTTGDADFDVDSDAGIGFQFITLKNFIAFFTIFGWTGITCLDAGLGNGMTLFLSIVAGTLMMLLMATLFYFISKLVESGTMKFDSAVGKTATVYLRIPANKSGAGKIQVNIQGLKTLDAMTNSQEDIKSGSMVKIVAVEAGDILMVELL